MPRRYKIFTALASITLILDQLSKWWARRLPTNDAGYGIAQPVIENFFDWRISYNTGSAFGLFRSIDGARVFLTIIGFVAIGAIFWMIAKARDDQKRFAWALGLVAGGAIGNVVDRVLFGKVTDFIVWKWYEHEWPTFNIADAALCIGVGLLFLDIGKEAKVPAPELDS
jgi:signal peptidase II